MLRSIEPPFHESHKAPIDSFLTLLKREHKFSVPPKVQTRSTFLIAADNQHGIYGGAVLYPQKIASTLDLEHGDTSEETLIKLTSAFQPKGEEYWTAIILLCLKPGSTAAPILEAQDVCHRFYQNLYRAFIAFGERMGIHYLAYTLQIAETYRLKTYQPWPCELDLVLTGPEAGFVYGILSLKGKPFRARRYSKWGRNV